MPNGSTLTGLLLRVTTAVALSGLAGCHPDVPGTPDARVTGPDAPWPMLGGSPDRNGVNLRARDIPAHFVPEGGENGTPGTNVIWEQQLGWKAYGSPVVAEGRIFVGTNNGHPRNPRDREKPEPGEEVGRPLDKGVLMCFDQASGQFLWQAVHDKHPAGLAHDWPREGIASTPCVAEGRLYYVSNDGKLVCADVDGFADGNQGIQTEKYRTDTDADFIWVLDMMEELKVSPHNLSVCSPLVHGDHVFVVTGHGIDVEHDKIPNPEAPSFIAVDRLTGRVRWWHNDPGTDIMHGQWGSPTLAVVDGEKQIIFPGGDGWLRAYQPATGTLIWKFDCNPKDAVYDVGGDGTRNNLIGPCVFADGKVYVGTGQDPEHLDGVGHLWCIDPSKAHAGNVDISPRENNLDPKAAVNKDSGLVWYFGGVETRPGSRREFRFGRALNTGCVVDGLLYTAELDGYLHCLDARTGKKFWHYDLRSGMWGGPTYADGKIFLGNEDGDFFVLRHRKEQPEGMDACDQPNRAKKKEILRELEKQLLIEMIFVDEPIRTTPVVADGVLYVMTERRLIAVGR